jgi:WD40 repeat protein
MNFLWACLKQITACLTFSALLTLPGNGIQDVNINRTEKSSALPYHEIVSMEGLYLGFQNDKIQLAVEEKLLTLPVAAQATICLVGEHAGRILTIQEFPTLIQVEVSIDETGTVQKIRNKLEDNPVIPGVPLHENGNLATLSPAENYYTLFHFLDGLFLYKLSPEQNNASQTPTDNPPVFLSANPICAWSKSGTKLAYTSPDHIEILTLNVSQTTGNNPTKGPGPTQTASANAPLKQKQYIPLYPNSNPIDSNQHECYRETVRVITSLEWSQNEQYLLASYLEDFPSIGSTYFQVAVFSPNGQELAKKGTENLGACCWLSEELILLLFNAEEKSAGKGVVWNWQNDETCELPIRYDGICSNLCYNPRNKTIAYTITANFSDQLYIHPWEESPPKAISPLQMMPFPIRHLQWTKDDCLLFWDEINNAITKINEHGETLCKYHGYLPEKSVASRFLYFAEEPYTEPLPLYLSPHL